MKKHKLYIIGFTLLVTGIYSCKKGDDLYLSPNSPSKATANTLLSAIEVGTFNNLEGGATRHASIFMQHNSGITGQALEPELYAPTESDMDNNWNGIYLNMKNCKILIDDFGGENPYYKGLAEVIMVMNLGLATDMWGDVPFSEALKGTETGENLMPKYDPQQSVLAAMQAMLDDAIANLAKTKTSNALLPGGDDYIYGGSTSAWTKLAYTLKARYYSRLSKKPGFDANTLLAYVSKGMASNADNCYAKHGNAGSESNQWASYIANRSYIVASQVLIDSMGNMNDPRTPEYFDTTGVGEAVGNPLGNLDVASYWGPYVGGYIPGDPDGNLNPAKSIVLVSYAETKFLEAEAKVRLGNATAFTTLNDAIKASVSEVTEGANDGSSIAIYTPLNTSLRTVILEKWKAMFTEPVEAYAAYRITGFPTLKPNPIGKLPFIPKRLPTSQGERTGNVNAPTPSLGTPVWYAE
jgi:hypothetical protein